MGYPKSGNTWISQLLADYLQLSLPSHSVMPIGCPAVIQSHYAPSKKRCRDVYVVRDGRDVMVSYYYYLSWDIPEGPNPQLTRQQRQWFPGLTDKKDIIKNLPRFIESQMTNPVASMGKNWATHVEQALEYQGPELTLVSYEEMLREPSETLTRLVEHIEQTPADPKRVEASIVKYDFRSQSGRGHGQSSSSSFLRSGTRGDWLNHFSSEACQMFDHYCGKTLIRAGYETDNSWVNSSSLSANAA